MTIRALFLILIATLALHAADNNSCKTTSQTESRNTTTHAEQPAFAHTLSSLARIFGMDHKTLEVFCDDTDFYSPKTTIMLPIKMQPTKDEQDTVSVHVAYEIRWGYHGAGNSSTPFSGTQAHISAPINYDGITFDVTQSRRFAATTLKKLTRYTTLSPLTEFTCKFVQLLWTHAREDSPNNDLACASMHILLSRLRITEGSSDVTIGDMALLGTPDRVGLDTLFYIAPERVMRNLIAFARDICYHCGIVLTPSQEVAAFSLRALLEQVNYTTDATATFTHDGISITLPFGYAEAGDGTQPFSGFEAAITMQPEQKEHISVPLSQVKFSPVQECVIKLFLLSYQVSKQAYTPHNAAEEYNTLLLRLSNTPDNDALDQTIRNWLHTICSGINRTTTHDFMQPINKTLSHTALAEHIVSIAYRLYIMHATQQPISEQNQFISVQLARSLKASQLFADVTNAGQQQVPLAHPSEKRFGFNIKLFLQTLLTEEC